MLYKRVWAMPTKDTFDCKPIGELVKHYLRQSKVSIDPFARNKRWATYTNDLNPNTEAEYHLDVLEFLHLMLDRGVKPDLVIFDPPYSLGQIKECYNEIGVDLESGWNQRTGRWVKEKDIIDKLLVDLGIVITCGWNSIGMGIKRGYKIINGLLVCHGGAHYDTIVTVESKGDTSIKSIPMF